MQRYTTSATPSGSNTNNQHRSHFRRDDVIAAGGDGAGAGGERFPPQRSRNEQYKQRMEWNGLKFAVVSRQRSYYFSAQTIVTPDYAHNLYPAPSLVAFIIRRRNEAAACVISMPLPPHAVDFCTKTYVGAQFCTCTGYTRVIV